MIRGRGERVIGYFPMMRRVWLRMALAWLIGLGGISLTAQEVPAPPASLTVHVVQRGESLAMIAERYGVPVEDLARYNGILNLGSIQVGQRLLVPLNLPTGESALLVHVVQPGESLESIAAQYGLSPQLLAERNAIADPTQLYIGLTLTIGSTVDEASSEGVPAPQLTDQPVITTRHVIASGETLYGIAQTYGITVAALQSANNITDPETIFAGQELAIPGVEPLAPHTTFPAPVVSLEVEPLILVTGQTARIRLTTTASAALTATFLDMPIPIIFDGVGFLGFLGVPIGTPAGIYPVAFTIAPEGGTSTEWSLNVQIVTGQYGTQYITLPEDRVNLLAPAVEENEINLLQSLTTGFTAERYFDGPLGLPAAAVMNAPFGVSRAYNGGPVDRYHNGADFAGAPGSPVIAAAPGRIVLADTLYIRGTTLMIDHGWGVFTVYAHLSERYVNLGDFVVTGQQIGAVGSTGRATGAHLHWELWVNGVAVDPLQWVRQAFP